MNQASGWDWFGAWAFVGALCSFTLLALASIGLFLLPFALLALFLVGRRGVRGPELLGLITGVGAIVILIGTLNTGDHGGLDPRPWLIVGAALVAAGVVAYAWRRSS